MLDDQPVLGMGEGGPRRSAGPTGASTRFSSTAAAGSTTCGRAGRPTPTARAIPVALLVGTGGWGLFVATPWGQVDLAEADRGVFIPWKPPTPTASRRTSGTSSTALGKGRPPVGRDRPGLYDLFVFDAREPAGS